MQLISDDISNEIDDISDEIDDISAPLNVLIP